MIISEVPTQCALINQAQPDVHTEENCHTDCKHYCRQKEEEDVKTSSSIAGNILTQKMKENQLKLQYGEVMLVDPEKMYSHKPSL